MNNYKGNEIVNIGVGKDITIQELAHLIKYIVKFNGEIVYDPNKPDGAPRKLVDTTKLNQMGWRASVSLEEGIRRTYEWFLENISKM